MQAIVTKYLGPTNFKGARIKASCERGSITVDYPHHLSGMAVHQEAVSALVCRFAQEDLQKYGTPLAENPWLRPSHGGALPNGASHDWAFVFASQ